MHNWRVYGVTFTKGWMEYMKEEKKERTYFDIEGFYCAKCCGTCEFSVEHDYNADLIKEVEKEGGKLSKLEVQMLYLSTLYDRYCDKHECRTITEGYCEGWEED